MKELAAQAPTARDRAAPELRRRDAVASKIGEPEVFLHADTMRARRGARKKSSLRRRRSEALRALLPVTADASSASTRARAAPRRSVRHQSELADRRVAARRRTRSPRTSASGSTWSPTRARSPSRAAAQDAARLKRLLYELGFRFEYPLVGRLETGDVEAIVELVGAATGARDPRPTSTASSIRAARRRSRSTSTSSRSPCRSAPASSSSRRRTSSAGCATSATRTSSATWCTVAEPPGQRPRPPPRPARAAARPARRHPRARALRRRRIRFRGRERRRRPTTSTSSDAPPRRSANAPSLLLHVVDGAVARPHNVDEPLDDLYVARDGTMWGLTHAHARSLRPAARAQSVPAPAPARTGARGGTASAAATSACSSGARARSSSSTAAVVRPVRARRDARRQRVGRLARRGRPAHLDARLRRSHGRRGALRLGAVAAHHRGAGHRVDARRPRRVARRRLRPRPRGRRLEGVERSAAPDEPAPTRQQAFLTEAGTRAPVLLGARATTAACCSRATAASSRRAPATPSSTRSPADAIPCGSSASAAGLERRPRDEAAAREVGVVALSGRRTRGSGETARSPCSTCTSGDASARERATRARA